LRELIIPIETNNPVDFFGIHDSTLEILRNNFPQLKIIGRGNEIKILGEEQDIQIFGQKFNLLLEYYKKFGSLEEAKVEQILSGESRESSSGSEKPNDVLVFGQNGMIIKARSPNQQKMVDTTDKNDIVFAIGPAGTGKTYTAVALAVRALKNKEIKRIILTRPAVEAGENLGFLPGDLKEKIDPYLRPLYDALFDMIPGEKLKSYIESGIIEVAPLAFMRGRTLDHAFIILDEAQNATESQLKMFLTRMGKSAKMIVTGDITQIDLPRNQPSGLLQAARILTNIKGIDFVHLDSNDVVRHRLVKEIIEAYGSLDK
jgi:phosphate starvation-inducible PhoH-like protein